jgi:hypothetical protein
MPVVGDGNHYGVDVAAREQFAVVVVGGTVLVSVVAIDGVERRLQVIRLDVAGCDDLAVGIA